MNNTKCEKIKIMLVDDQHLFVESLKVVIETIAPDMEVSAIACNGEEAVKIMNELFEKKKYIDIVLMDVRMPIMDGVTASKLLHDTFPRMHIIMLTTFEDDDYVTKAMQNGASGYLLKNIAPHMLTSAVRAVHDGSVLLDPNIVGSLVQNVCANHSGSKHIMGEVLPDWYYELSPRERTIIKHLLLGKTNKEIASDICIGEQTIRNYISSIYTKMNAAGRRDAIRLARTISPAFF